MIILDCESRDSALASLSTIYGVPTREITQFLQETDLEKHYATCDPPNSVDRELALLFEQGFGSISAPISRVFWFHLTRAKPGADFARGILPLDEALNEIWETMLAVFKGTHHETNLRALRRNGVPDFQYELKVGQPAHGGPFAMLVRESAFRAQEMGNHDYLRLPEIMADICNGYDKTYSEAIHNDLREALVPYIVKFWSNEQSDKSYAEAAMYYLYCTVHGLDLSIYANTCFIGDNNRIPREHIVSVEAIQQ